MMNYNNCRLVLFVFIGCFLSCSQIEDNKNVEAENNNTFFLRSSMESYYVGDGFSYCDTLLEGDESCFITYQNRRYLKREKVFYDTVGRIERALIYKPEGSVIYYKEQLIADTLLLKYYEWQLNNNVVQINGDKITKPFSGNVTELKESRKEIYFLSEPLESGKQFLYVYEYW